MSGSSVKYNKVSVSRRQEADKAGDEAKRDRGMMSRAAFLALLSLLAMAHSATALPRTGGMSMEGRGPVSLQLVQMPIFDVYIDGYGREVVVDSRTGEIVEIRPPRRVTRPQPLEVPERDSRIYDFSDPRDIERYRREREVELGRREPPPVSEEFRDDFNGPPDIYPEAPIAREEPSYGIERDTVRRAPLDDPSGEQIGENPNESTNNEFAAVPEPNSQEGSDSILEPGPLQTLPGGSGITVPMARGASEEVAKFQVLLDRAGASPGVIDGQIGDNVNKAIEAYEEITGQKLKTYDKKWIEEQLEATGGPAFVEYTITVQDAAGPYVASIPEDYGEKAQLDHLGFTSVSEALAERFHMDENYLKALNPGANFNRPGTIIRVVNPGTPVKTEVKRLVADKSRKQLLAYDADDRLVAVYPATIGSADTPSPTGIHAVSRVALDPNYTYNPKVNFKQGNNDKILTLPPGPNGPVGSVWIALDKPTYGVHGTPEPSKIGKTSSHGCVRLTNWDAQELANLVKPGVTVEFVD